MTNPSRSGDGPTRPEVKVTFAGKQVSTQPDKSRRWVVGFPAMAANSSPQSMEITCGNESVRVENILIGDVWLLGGQSNMEHPIFKSGGWPVRNHGCELSEHPAPQRSATEWPGAKDEFPPPHGMAWLFQHPLPQGLLGRVLRRRACPSCRPSDTSSRNAFT